MDGGHAMSREPNGRAAFGEYRGIGETLGRSETLHDPATGRWTHTCIDTRGGRLLPGGAPRRRGS